MPLTNENDDKSALDVLAEGTLREQLGIDEPEPPEEKVEEKPAPVVDDRIDKILARQEKLETQLFEAKAENQYYRGALSQRPQPAAEPEDEELDLNFEEITADIEARGSKALVDVIRKVVAHERKSIGKEVDGRVNQRLGQQSAVDNRRQAFTNELNTVTTEFAPFWNDEFKAEADAEAMKILQLRGGKSMQDFMPGDLYSAASRVAARWERTGKGVNTVLDRPKSEGASIRELVRRVPDSDSIGKGSGQRGAKTPKTIDDLDYPERDKAAAKNVFRRLKALNPGMSEERWVASYIKGRNEEAA
jgi:hypothetical protein